ncbi:MAG: hydrogen gas-evolving membrane-bound hydrogenase subunit E [Candidatus Caldatribacteriota bacterium]|nr:hydrogen gas-evolving membrane-bound hydrogenase subunit E [Candidatus Caldatribacteriota bacterium]
MKKIIFAITFLIFFSFLMVGAINMRTFGEPAFSEMDDYFIENAQSETGANNVVTSIVFDYRGFDTLGEATVLFTAVVGVVALFRGVKK